MNLGLLTAIWGRPRLTDLVLRYYEGFDLIRAFVASEEDESDLDVKWKWLSTFADNEPLSDKWNFGMDLMSVVSEGDEEMDGVMIVGSDDLVTPKYVEAVKYLLSRGADYIFLPALYFYDLKSGSMHYCLSERLGLGRVLSRRLLDMLDWKPWPDGLNSGLDGAMWDNIKELKEVKIVKLDMKTCSRLGIAALDIKGDGENIWNYHDATGSLLGQRVREPERILHKHFPSVSRELLNWNTKHGND